MMKKAFLLLLLFFAGMAVQAQTTFQVTNTNDSGPGSLRQAILDAGSSFSTRIVFNLGSNATINISTPLPPLKIEPYFCSSSTFLYLTITASGSAATSAGFYYESTYNRYYTRTNRTITQGSNYQITYQGFDSTTFTVTNTNDSGDGSLLWAVASANDRRVNNSCDKIVFNIPQPAPVLIENCPIGLSRGMIIDGSTQPANGYTGSAPKIILANTTNTYVSGVTINFPQTEPDSYYATSATGIFGLEIRNFPKGIDINSYTFGLSIGAPGKGNVINGSIDAGIYWYSNSFDQNGSPIVISNNYIGTDATGTLAIPNKYGIRADGFFEIPENFTIQNNVISGNSKSGIYGNFNKITITGNIIGLSATGDFAIPNEVGIESTQGSAVVNGSAGFANAIIGGPGAKRNIISGNTNAAIFIYSQIYIGQITNNYIGTDITGQVAIPNGYGIQMRSTANTNLVIGGNTLAEGNLIAHNGAAIVSYYWPFTTPSGTFLIKNNSIYNNGIGVLAPLATPVITTRSSTTIAGTATPNATVQLFEDDLQQLSPQGKTFIAEVSTDASGNWSYNGAIANPCQVTAICYQTSTSKSSGFSVTRPDILPDSSKFCSSTTATLDGTPAFNSYLWSDGTTAQQFSTNVEGKYWVSTTLGSCYYSDTTYVVYVPTPVIDLGKDTTLCGSYTLSTGTFNGAKFQWKKDGSDLYSATSQSYTVSSQSGAYMVVATIGYCVGTSNTVNITARAFPTTNNDTIQKCTGEPFTITKPTFYTYLWQDGSTANTFSAPTPGRYSVAITNTNGCVANDTTTVLDVMLPVKFGADTTICYGQSILYDFTYPGAIYTWSNSNNHYTSSNATYTISSPGQYRIFSRVGNCIKRDTINVTNVYKPFVNLGNDTIVCNSSPLIKSINPSAGVNYTWSNGSHGNSISITNSGQYWVDARVNAGCFRRDTINVQVLHCNSVSGIVYDDANQNRIKDATENVIPSQVVIATNGTLTYYAISDANGRYTLEAPDGTYQIRPSVSGISAITEPQAQSYTAYLNSAVSNPQQYNFGLFSYSTNMSISISSPQTARIGSSFTTTITVTNNGRLAASGRFNLNADPFFILTSSSIPVDSIGGVKYIDPGVLNSDQSVTVVLHWLVPVNLSLMGKSLTVAAQIDLFSDQVYTDNFCSSLVLITYSYDPNRISVKAQNFPVTQQPYNTSLLQYLIEFQNTGTDYAEDIVIIDTLPAGVDPSTLTMSLSSHPYTVELYGEGIVKFTFENIILPDSNTNEVGSHGYISFKINHRSLAVGAVIENKAYIYFDANVAVQTNTCIYRISGSANRQNISSNSIYGNIYNDVPYVVLNARSSSGLPIEYAYQGPVTFSRDTLFLTGATGNVKVGMYQEGNATFNRADPRYAYLTVIKRSQTLSLSTIPNHIATDAPFSISATGGASGQPVEYTIVSGPATISNNIITLTGAGTVVVQATQAGNTYYSAAIPVTQSFNVSLATQTISTVTISDKLTTDLPFDLTFTGGGSGNPILYTIVSGPATVSGNTITLTGQAGTVIVQATQLGNSLYADATAAQVSFEVTQATSVMKDDLPATF